MLFLLFAEILLGSGSFSFHEAALFVGDSLQDDSQAGDGSQHGAQNLSLQDGQSGDVSQSHNLVEGHDLAIHETALDLEVTIALLGEIVDDAGRSNGIVVADSQRSGTIQDTIQLVHTAVLCCEAQQGASFDEAPAAE